jgi:diguanylate cyclase (GGDEF)-like protein/PAS domain S-box-containing protein
MKNRMKQWLAPPVFEGDEEKTHKASLLNAIVITGLVVILLVIFGNLLDRKTPVRNFIIDFLFLASMLYLRHELYKGRIEFAGLVIPVIGFILSTATIVSEGTILSPATSSYLLLVIIVGILFDTRALAIAIIVSSLSLLLLMLALAPSLRSATMLDWFVFTVLFGVTGGLVFFVVHNMRTSLEKVQSEIEESKRMDIELRKLTRAVEQNPASIVITDLNGKIEYVNPRFTQVTGYGFEESIGKNPRILKTPMTPPETHRQLWENLLSGQEWHGEFVNRKKDDSIYYESAVISPIFDEAGRPSHYLAIKEDITQTRKTISALRASEARFRALFNQNHDGVFIIGLDGKTKDVNQRAAEMLGYSIEELREGKDRESIAAPEIPSDNSFVRVLAGEHIPIFERVFRKKDGSTFPVEINLELVRDEDGTALHMQSIIRDITKRKQSEMALQKNNEQLNQQNEYLSILHQVTLDLLNHRSVDELLQLVVDRAVILLDAIFCELMLEKDGELIVQTCTQNLGFLKGDRVGRAEAKLSWLAFDTKIPVVLDDYSNHPDRREIYSETKLHAVVDLPVLVRSKCIGVLAMGRSRAGYLFSEAQIKNGMLFAQLIALVLDNAQLFSAAEHEISERKQAEDALQKANEQLRVDIEKIEQLKEELREQAIRDPLTGMYNRRYLDETLGQEIARASRARSPISFVMIDIDHFKQVNDAFGHDAGDQVLRKLAGLLLGQTRPGDIVCRYGGEEILVVIPNTSAEVAFQITERWRLSFTETPLPLDLGPTKITISCGISEFPKHGTSAIDLISFADKAMYQAKSAGRNRVFVWQAPQDTP